MKRLYYDKERDNKTYNVVYNIINKCKENNLKL